MSDIDYQSLENRIRDDFLECRRLFTRSVTDNPSYSTTDLIQADYMGFLKEVFKAHKSAMKILIDGILYLEDLIIKANDANSTTLQKEKTAKLRYWKILLESSYNTLVWLNVGMDRSNYKRIFKGPKRGYLVHQNIELLLRYIRDVNKNPDEIAIPLDFCSFSPICDFLKVSWSENEKKLRRYYIEAKSGKVNDEMIETIEDGTKEAYFEFFDTYGEKGIKQIDRCFRQMIFLNKSTNLIDTDPGIYEDPTHPKAQLAILDNEAVTLHFSDIVAQLLEKGDRNEFAVDLVDDCLVIGVINTEDKRLSMLSEYDLRLYIFHAFIDPETLKGTPYPPDLSGILDNIPLGDWLKGFGSVVFEPITLRRIPDRYLIELLLAKKRLKFYFSPKEFISLCNKRGLEARFATKKEVSHMKSSGLGTGLADINGQFISVPFGGNSFIFGEGILHEMLFNWVRPTSIINMTKQRKFPYKH